MLITYHKFEINCPKAPSPIGAVIKLDGQALSGIRNCQINIAANNAVTISLEFYPAALQVLIEQGVVEAVPVRDTTPIGVEVREYSPF